MTGQNLARRDELAKLANDFTQLRYEAISLILQLSTNGNLTHYYHNWHPRINQVLSINGLGNTISEIFKHINSGVA